MPNNSHATPTKTSSPIPKLIPILLVFLTLPLAGLYLGIHSRNINSPSSTPPVATYSSQQQCEAITNRTCTFQNCDYIPEGQSFEQTCGPNFRKGWVATDQPISSPNPTSAFPRTNIQGWQTFQSRQHQLSLQYPSNWKVNQLGQAFEQGDLISLALYGPTQSNDTTFYDGARLAISNPITIDQDLITWVENNPPPITTNSKTSSETSIEFASVTINDVEYYTASYCGTTCKTFYHTLQNGHVFTILTSAHGENQAQYQQIINNILFTLTFQSTTDPATACQQANGIWFPEYNECENIDLESCTQAGGTFNGCASPCRNNPKAETCASVCIPVCSF